MPHPNQPSLEELKRIMAELYASESTNENMKKIQAIEAQISRTEAEAAKPTPPSNEIINEGTGKIRKQSIRGN